VFSSDTADWCPAARGIARTEGIETGSVANVGFAVGRPRAASPAPRALKQGDCPPHVLLDDAARGIARTEGIETRA